MADFDKIFKTVTAVYVMQDRTGTFGSTTLGAATAIGALHWMPCARPVTDSRSRFRSPIVRLSRTAFYTVVSMIWPSNWHGPKIPANCTKWNFGNDAAPCNG
mgnify:CR=1 FL=1